MILSSWLGRLWSIDLWGLVSQKQRNVWYVQLLKWAQRLPFVSLTSKLRYPGRAQKFHFTTIAAINYVGFGRCLWHLWPCRPVDLQTYRKDPVLSKYPFMPHRHTKTDFCAEDLFASTELVDISCTFCLPFSNRKISLWIIELCKDGRTWSANK